CLCKWSYIFHRLSFNQCSCVCQNGLTSSIDCHSISVLVFVQMVLHLPSAVIQSFLCLCKWSYIFHRLSFNQCSCVCANGLTSSIGCHSIVLVFVQMVLHLPSAII